MDGLSTLSPRSAVLAELSGRIFTAMVAHYSPAQAEENASEMARRAVAMASRLLAACETRAELEAAVQEAVHAPDPAAGGVMDPGRFIYALKVLGWTYKEAGRRMGVNWQRMRRFATAERPVDRDVAEWLEQAVMFFEMNPPPKRQAHHQETSDGE